MDEIKRTDRYEDGKATARRDRITYGNDYVRKIVSKVTPRLKEGFTEYDYGYYDEVTADKEG